MNIERLQHLIQILENVPAEKFDLSKWKCGTTACAIGWACSDPSFNEQGLRMTHFSHLGEHTLYCPILRFGNRKEEGWDAVTQFFDITREQADYLFANWTYQPSQGTTENVILRIKGLLNA